MRKTLLLSLLITTILAYCPYGNKPVCGSDNKTYLNLCKLNKSQATLKHEGQCVFKQSATDPSQLVANCTNDFDPVCGIDGVTYGNDCRRQFRGIDLAYRGPCGVEGYDPAIFANKQCTCSYEWHPVCTRNSKINFENLCFIRCIHQLEGSFDACKAPCQCSLDYDPVCSTEGITYDNECQINCAQKTKALNGECESLLFDCDSGCSRSFAPVCAKTPQGEKTMRNKCFASCSGFKVLKEGLCDMDSKDPSKKDATKNAKSSKSIEALCMRCSREIKVHPVCSEDGVTYENECQCACQNGGKCPKYSDGPCPTFDEFKDKCTHCQSVGNDPWCGNDHKTYENLCYMQCNGTAPNHKGKCRNFEAAPRRSFDMRSNASVGARKQSPSVEQLFATIQQLMMHKKSGQHVDRNVIEKLMQDVQYLKNMHHSH